MRELILKNIYFLTTTELYDFLELVTYVHFAKIVRLVGSWEDKTPSLSSFRHYYNRSIAGNMIFDCEGPWNVFLLPSSFSKISKSI